MKMNTQTHFRGFARVRAETPTPAATLDAINRAVTEMRAKYDEELAAVRAGQSDIVRTEEVNRINASITELTNTLNAQQEAIASAAALGGAGRNALSPEARQHAETFNQWFRRPCVKSVCAMPFPPAAIPMAVFSCPNRSMQPFPACWAQFRPCVALPALSR
jgi:predicted phage gp36 major capsid-like protein